MLKLPLATLIVWPEEDGSNFALSFQEAEGCTEIWGDINEVQQQYADDLFSDPVDINDTIAAEYIPLPDPDISNLKDILELIKEAQSNGLEKEKLSTFITVDNYINKLFPVLETCEDLEAISELHLLHDIILEIYDPEAVDKKIADYRGFLTKRSKFKQIIPINDPEVEQKIHQVFRVQFLRDTVLPRYLDEGLSSVFASMIFFLNIDIVNAILRDQPFLKSLFEIVESDTEPLERKRDVVRTLCQNGLFNVFDMALSDDERSIKMAGAEIMLSALEHDPSLVRTYIVKQSEGTKQRRLFDVLIDQFLAEQDAGIMIQLSELIRVLLDTNPNPNEGGIPTTIHSSYILDPDADKFLDLFYSQYVANFVSALLNLSEAALKFFRSCIGLNDEFYCTILIKNNVIGHIIDVLFEDGHKNNLVNSICLEFFEYIRDGNIKSLLGHVVTVHGERIKDIAYTDTFRKLISSYEMQTQLVPVAEGEADTKTSASTPDVNETASGPSGEEVSSPEVGGIQGTINSSEDDDEDQEQNDSSASQGGADAPPESESLPRPPRRKLADVEGDNTKDDTHVKSTGDASEANGPPEKRKRLNGTPPSRNSPVIDDGSDSNNNGNSCGGGSDGDESSNGSPGNHNSISSTTSSGNVSAEALSPSSVNETKSKPIGPKNGRSPSLSPIYTAMSKSPINSASPSPPLSPLPRIAARTGIAFVKGGTDLKDLEQQDAIQDASKTQAAIQLKSELATGTGRHSGAEAATVHLAKRRREDSDTDSSDSSDGRPAGASRRKTDQKETNSPLLNSPVTPPGIISPTTVSDENVHTLDRGDTSAAEAAEERAVMNKGAATPLRVSAE
ncbi:Platinum sensitivity protein [Entomortierella chlamydospora]|uniref:Platinum sensitivity protein n=1 Tax=Entomortierella chlamydospora TaxID=101097 RepID=A0A9P6MP47_9FUNG|nr:Platinum sensitivity protein [Entomortierella chlamydospora]